MNHRALRALPTAIVTIELGRADDGLIPILVGVVPTSSFSRTGVFVDLRRSAQHPSVRSTMFDGLSLCVHDLEAATPTTSTTEVTATDGEGSPHAAGTAPVRADLSAQIALAGHFTVGEPESFIGEVTIPPTPPSGECWYVRGRFGSRLGPGVRSPWRRLELG
jgi:hypothetical protein